jgi:hypothetical protein
MSVVLLSAELIATGLIMGGMIYYLGKDVHFAGWVAG